MKNFEKYLIKIGIIIKKQLGNIIDNWLIYLLNVETLPRYSFRRSTFVRASELTLSLHDTIVLNHDFFSTTLLTVLSEDLETEREPEVE